MAKSQLCIKTNISLKALTQTLQTTTMNFEKWKWRIQGRGPGEGSRGGVLGTQPLPHPPPLLLDQTEARRAEINFFGDQAPPYLRVWMTAPLPPPPQLI